MYPHKFKKHVETPNLGVSNWVINRNLGIRDAQFGCLYQHIIKIPVETSKYTIQQEILTVLHIIFFSGGRLLFL
jgi:hypothetical protein